MTETYDLGVFNDSILVFGGPYSNLEAMKSLLAEADRHGIPPDRMLCTGDVVAYCADPRATVDLVRNAGIAVVMGNCEESVGAGAEDCGCGYEEGSSCDLMAAHWYAYSVAELDESAKAWMRNLPRRIAFTLGTRRLVAIHGGVEQINQFVFASTPASNKAADVESLGADGVIAGHSGLPFTQIVGERLWHNAGVIGLPANDGTPRVWYSLLRPDKDGIAIEHHALSYDHGAAARKMRERGLPLPYADALATGLWPSDDVMAAAERGNRGQPLAPPEVYWRH